MTFPRSTLALLVLCSGTPAGAGVNTWTPTGPDGGDAIAVAFHPSTPGTVFTVSGGTIYRSTNFGQAWTVVRPRGGASVGRIVIDPSNASRVMVAAQGNAFVYRSDDGGVSFGSALAPGSTWKLAIATDGSALYLSTFEKKVFRSVNFGATWEDRSQGLPTTNNITDLVVDPTNANTLYALIESLGLYKSVDGGVSWTLKNALTGISGAKLAVDPGLSTDLLLAGPDAGLQASHDGGGTWVQEHAGRFMWVGYHPTAPGGGAAVALAPIGRAARRAGRGGPWLDGQQLRLTTVAEAAFDPTNLDANNSTLLVATTEGPLLTQDSGTSFAARSQGLRGATVNALAAAGGAQPTMYAGYSAGPVGIYRHMVTGWTAADNAELKALLLNPLLPLAIGADFANSDTLFVTSAGGTVRSPDGGQSWLGPLPTGFGLGRSISFAPSNSQVIYAGTENGVYRSDTQGVTWFPRSTGLPPAVGVGAIVVDPSASGTVYAALQFPQAVPVLFKTTDAGEAWAPATAGLDLTFVETLAIDPVNTQVVYAGGSLNPGVGLFKSTNAGQSWQRIAGPNGSGPARSIAVDPVVPSTLFMTADAAVHGVARSVDGGATWESLSTSPSGPFFERLALDPTRPYTVVAAVNDDGLYEFEVSPDLEATLTTVPATIAFGGTGSPTITVKNRGPFAASAVKITISLPLGTTAAIPTPSQGTCARVGTVLECSFGAVREAQEVTTVVTLTAGTVPTTGTLTATATGHESDPAPGNNTASAAIAVERVADLGVTLAPSAAAVDHQAPVTLTAVATNAGPNSSAVTQLVIDLGAGLAFQSANPTQGTCTYAGTAVTCDLGELAAAAQVTVAVATTAASTGALTPSAQISFTGVDPAAANNSASASVTSRPVANAGVQLSDSADPVIAGQALQYTATVTNAGPDDLVGSTVTIALSAATASSATSGQGTCTTAGANVTCTMNALPKDGTATITINAVANAAGTAVASAGVAHAGTDTDAANNTATQSTTVNAPPSSGGGGAGGLLELLALLALCLSRRTTRSSSIPRSA